MTATSQTSSSSDSATVAGDLGSDLIAALSSADSTAAQRVQNLGLVHQARLAQLTRTVASITAQYGAGSTQAIAAEAAVTAAKATIARIAIVKQQVTTPAPQIAAAGWALHGRVFDTQLEAVSGYTVFLVDGQKTYQQSYGFAYTDDTGYFLLNYAGSEPQSKGKSRTQGVVASQLFLEIANPKGQPVYLSATPFQPALGSAVYQNVTLPSGGQPIGDPPKAIRKVALPSKKKRS